MSQSSSGKPPPAAEPDRGQLLNTQTLRCVCKHKRSHCTCQDTSRVAARWRTWMTTLAQALPSPGTLEKRLSLLGLYLGSCLGDGDGATCSAATETKQDLAREALISVPAQ